jgi:2-polyprenyl-6-methoxyphenol hydroxylase-like FAD-dependent oxidoreductase
VTITVHGGVELRARLPAGADGPFSTVRRQCLDDGEPEPTGDALWEGIAPGDLERDTAELFWGRLGVHGGAIPVDRDGNTAWWVAADTGPLGRTDMNPHKTELHELLAEMKGPLPALVEATDERAIGRRDVFGRRHGRVAGAGRVTLVGAAGHPLPVTLALGPTLAIEDAAQLADALAGAADPITALRVYEQQRTPRIEAATHASWRLHAVEAPDNPALAWVRDLLLRHAESATLVPGLLSASP